MLKFYFITASIVTNNKRSVYWHWNDWHFWTQLCALAGYRTYIHTYIHTYTHTHTHTTHTHTTHTHTTHTHTHTNHTHTHPHTTHTHTQTTHTHTSRTSFIAPPPLPHQLIKSIVPGPPSHEQIRIPVFWVVTLRQWVSVSYVSTLPVAVTVSSHSPIVQRRVTEDHNIPSHRRQSPKTRKNLL